MKLNGPTIVEFIIWTFLTVWAIIGANHLWGFNGVIGVLAFMCIVQQMHIAQLYSEVRGNA